MTLVERLHQAELGYGHNKILFCEASKRIQQLEAEVIEQCRLNGIGSEREAALMGKVERLEALLNAIASTAHCGGLSGMSESDALIAIRKATLPYFDTAATDEQHREALASTPESSLAEIRRAERLEAHNAVLREALKETTVALEHRWEVIANRAAPVMESVIDAAHTKGINTIASTPESSLAEIRRAERERCAEVCEGISNSVNDQRMIAAIDCAAAIRQMED